MCIATTRLLRRVPLIRQRSQSQVRAMAKYSYEWPRPALTVDAVIVAKPAGSAPAQLLLIQRKHPPCQGQWALPGGFVNQGEPLDAAAARELQEETSVDPKDVDMVQVGSYGDPGRDPRGWTVTVAYAAVVPSTELGVKAADDAAAASWYPVKSLPSLAFDHKQIIREAFQKLLERPEVQQAEAMVTQLTEGARALEGPWTPPKE
eukprot:GHRQ01010717.1.p1 GENE.GHRQ01010717.1~~GHRQ01010717.1.p1  ORF type:complete len:205 (+),score=63.24 GHRQ01010717.1:219-833(+)